MKKDFDVKIDIGLVGNTQVGKTALIRRYVYNNTKKAMNTISTIGIETETVRFQFNNLKVKV
jgi:GTPase SAR1 family protein